MAQSVWLLQRAVQPCWSKSLTPEVLKLAGKASNDLQVKRITLRNLQFALCGAEGLEALHKAMGAGGGVILGTHTLRLGGRDTWDCLKDTWSFQPQDPKYSNSCPGLLMQVACTSVKKTFLPFYVILCEQAGSLISFLTNQISASES